MSFHQLIRRHLAESWQHKPLRRIILRASQLRGQCRTVADYIIEQSDNWSTLSVRDVSEAVGVSPSTVRRTLAALGLQGLREPPDGSVPTAAVDDPTSLPHYAEHAERLLSDVYDTLHELEGQRDRIAEAARLLAQAPFIQVYGTVMSAGIASMFDEKLASLGLLSRFSSDTDATIRSLPRIPPGGVLFCVSLLGATSHMGVRVLAAAKRQSVATIVLTNHRYSAAAELGSVILTTGIADPDLHHLDLLARCSQLLVLEVLADEIRAIRRAE